jgi:hypothetical protein
MTVDRDQIAARWQRRGSSCGVWTDPPGQVWEDFVHATDAAPLVQSDVTEIPAQRDERGDRRDDQELMLLRRATLLDAEVDPEPSQDRQSNQHGDHPAHPCEPDGCGQDKSAAGDAMVE